VASKWWLTYWSAHGNKDNQVFFLGIYGAINLFNIIAIFARLVFIMIMGLRASRKVGGLPTVDSSYHRCLLFYVVLIRLSFLNFFRPDLFGFTRKYHACSHVIF